MRDFSAEVYSSIAQHKTRSILSGLGIAWGMFILIVLLGAGNGFRNGMLDLFGGYASNSIWVTGYWTSQTTPGGLPQDVRIKFNDETLEKLKTKFRQIKFIAPEIPFETWDPVTYKNKANRFEIKGIGEDYLKIKLLEIGEGRSLNRKDYKDIRRSVIIGGQVKDILFGKEDPIGKYIGISGVFFQVVGVIKEGTMYSMKEHNQIYIPDKTLFRAFNIDQEHYTFGALLNPNTQTDFLENEIRSFLAQDVGFSKNEKGLYINNIQSQVKAFNSLFNGINIFLWILGLCFLLSGIIGITNIMFVVVKERTTEIGIRKAIGATPISIMHLILLEALIITVFFGIIGLLFGYGGMAIYNWGVAILQEGQQAIFREAIIDGYIVLCAFILLIASGILAGLIPAKKAAKIMPIETLNRTV